MGIGNDRVLPWENGIQATGTGIWSLEIQKNVKNKKWEEELSAAKWDFKTKGLGNRIGTLL